MAEARGVLRALRHALGLCAVLVLAACAPLPVAAPDADSVEAAPAQAGAVRSTRPVRGARPAPAPAPASAETQSADPARAEPVAEPPRESDEQGLASWHGPGLHGRRTANGERFDRYELTAAHRTLPFGTRVCVRSAVTGKTVVVRINDRGPFTRGRVIDLSQAAAQELGMAGLGIKPVELWLLNEDEEACPESLAEASVAEEPDDASAAPVARKKAPAKLVPKKTVGQTARKPQR